MRDEVEHMAAAIVARFDCTPEHAARVAAWMLGEAAVLEYREPAGVFLDECVTVPAADPRAWAAKRPKAARR